ncbi:GDSL-like Lipase/Acylhydrolase [Stieleria bergensis]|uniref:GDSL-like Lipase/Acylhydrolase n=2 Tax=Stieleria bergensis TaxID=2528025 RepID=A0A517SW88_9BACT|nr:GDSL-like Lipase/Acylhydrolase [Planctomycetes bacterium SV_7m_r]
MKRLLIAAGLCLAMICTSLAQHAEIKLANSTLKSDDTVVFVGDSITHQVLYTQYIEDFFITRYPQVRLHFHNAGIGGDRAWDALQRLDRDVISKQPDLVTILLGMNDASYQPFNPEVFAMYQADMTQLLERLQTTDAAIAPITPTMFDAVAARATKRERSEDMLRQYNAVLAFYGTWLRGEADRRSMTSIDMFSPLNNLTRQARLNDADYTMIKDAIHPGPDGQLVMASAWLEDLGLRGGVSNIVLTPFKESYKARVQNGTVTDLKITDGTIEFVFTGHSLPWVTPTDTAAARDMLKIGHRFSREGFQVHGLEPGKYELQIDGTVIDSFTHVQLANHVELQNFPNTPQSIQAAQVVSRNQTRSSETVRALRTHWFKFRNLQRSQRTLSEASDPKTREGLAAKVAKNEAAMEGFEAQLVELEAKAAAELDELYELAQPKPHRYTLRQVK